MKELKKSLDDSSKQLGGERVGGSDAPQSGSTNGREADMNKGLEDMLKADFDVDAVKNWIDVSKRTGWNSNDRLLILVFLCRRISNPSILTSSSTCRWRSLRHL